MRWNPPPNINLKLEIYLTQFLLHNTGPAFKQKFKTCQKVRKNSLKRRGKPQCQTKLKCKLWNYQTGNLKWLGLVY